MRILASLLIVLGLLLGGCAIAILADGIVGNPFAWLAAVGGLVGGLLTAAGCWVFQRAQQARRRRPEIDHPDFTGLP